MPADDHRPQKKENLPDWYRFDDNLGISRGDIVNVLISAVFGAVAGWALSTLFSSPTKVELWIVIALAMLTLTTCAVIVSFLTAFQREGRDRITSIAAAFQSMQRVVSDSIEGSAVLIPRESIYPEMARCIREATEQVVVITYYMYDWDNDRRTFEPTVMGDVNGVDEFYEAIYAAISDPDVEYLRVWQVPRERISEARSRIIQEARLAKEIELIESISPDNPDRCRVKIIPESTTASIVLVDRRTLFFNIDFFDSERGLWMSPFMLMVRDVRGRAFNDLKRVVVKLST